MVSHIITASVIGIEAYKISVEVDFVRSLPKIAIVGLPDTAVNEARERLRPAVKNSGFEFPNKKVVINLAPADIRKEGTNYDLAMAVGILAEDNIIDKERIKNVAFVGELSLDGTLRAVTGILPIVAGLKKFSIEKIIVPAENAKEAAIIPDIEVYGVKTLSDVVNLFSDNPENIEVVRPKKIDIKEYFAQSNENILFDFKDVKGQFKAKKALELAAAGAHNILMVGSPGSGKTLLAKCFASILPPLSLEEALELTKIYSVSGMITNDAPLITQRPFRPVHHTASAVGIIGGGSNPKPGEITLAHRGVLFLDEFVEFPRNVLEVLRQPLEDSEIVISRSQLRVKYPANFILIAAMNPCPCGYLGDSQVQCTCNEFQISRYRSKLSGPLLDRIDIHIEVPRLKSEELINMCSTSESSETIKNRVILAREIQKKRYEGTNIITNSELNAKTIKKYCKLDADSENLLKSAANRFNISGRGFDRILKLARTIADLENKDNISAAHIAQSLQYRNLV